MADLRTELLRGLPAVDVLMANSELLRAQELYGRGLVLVQVRRDLDRLRDRIRAGEVVSTEAELKGQPDRILQELEAGFGRPLRRVLNATGILLHTNLGRAPLPRAVADRLPELVNAYCDLEYELDSGQRIDRNRRAAALLEAATDAPASLVVNNNAAAMVLALNALALGRQVIISRGELVEIGGSFRIPDLLEAAGVRLAEVGTTNRTTVADYERAVDSETALLLKVYPSNYRQAGYVASVEPRELVALGRKCEIPVMVDEGSGLLRASDEREQLRGHPSLSQLVADGCDLACGSGDKLLGGPQAGLLVGKKEFVDGCRKHPLYRAFRPGRTALAALESVLRMHLAGEELPLDRLWPDASAHRERLAAAAGRLDAEIVDAEAFLGGGSAPDRPVPGEALALGDEPRLAAALRSADPPVVGYSKRGKLILDLRTVDPVDDRLLTETVLATRRALDPEGTG